MNIDKTTKTAFAAALIFTTACGGGINLGKNDSNVTGNGGSAGKGKPASDTDGGTVTPPVTSACGDGGLNAASTVVTTMLPELAPGGEDFQCVRRTVTADEYVTRFQSQVPSGSVYAVEIGIGAPTGPDGTTLCDAGTLGATTLFDVGAGTTDIASPAGLALHLAAGQQLLLNVHRLNPTVQPSDIQVAFFNAPPSTVTDDGNLYVPTTASAQDQEFCTPTAELVSASAVVPPGGELIRCTRKTVTADIDLTAILASNVLSYTLVSYGVSNGEPDGTVDCTRGTTQGTVLFGANPGTELITLPVGTSVHIAAGEQILLKWDPLNTSNTPLTASADVSFISSGATGTPATLPLGNAGTVTDSNP